MEPKPASPDLEVVAPTRFNQSPVAPPKSTPAPTGRFAALKLRNFRLFWGGAFVSNIGNWMQTIAQNWLVLSLTQSPFLLGLVNFIGNIPMLLLGLYGGVVADRRSRRTVLFVTQTMMMLLTLLMAVLTWLNVIDIWLIIIIVLGTGIVQAFNSPAYQTIMLDLVGKENLMNAIALNSLQFNLSRIIGPSLAGLLVVALGVAACFFINALSFGAVILALFMVTLPALPAANIKRSALSEIGESLVYLKKQPVLLVLIANAGAFSVFIFPYLSLLAVFAKDVYKSGADAYGLLMGAVGVGAVIGAIIAAGKSDMTRRSPTVIIGSAVLVAGLFGISLSPQLWMAMPFLALVGGSMVMVQTAINTTIQTSVPDQMRGRIISVWQLMSMGFLPLGSLLGGSVAEWVGAPLTVALGALVFGVITLFSFWLVPELREF